MFWGIILESGKKYTQALQRSFRVTMAALGLEKPSSGPVGVYVEINKVEYLLCCLRADHVPQQRVDLHFSVGEHVTFYLSGDGLVHLTGYDLPDDGGNDVFDESSSSEDEIIEQLLQPNNINGDLAVLHTLNNKTPVVVPPKQNVCEDENITRFVSDTHNAKKPATNCALLTVNNSLISDNALAKESSVSNAYLGRKRSHETNTSISIQTDIPLVDTVVEERQGEIFDNSCTADAAATSCSSVGEVDNVQSHTFNNKNHLVEDRTINGGKYEINQSSVNAREKFRTEDEKEGNIKYGKKRKTSKKAESPVNPVNPAKDDISNSKTKNGRVLRRKKK